MVLDDLFGSSIWGWVVTVVVVVVIIVAIVLIFKSKGSSFRKKDYRLLKKEKKQDAKQLRDLLNQEIDEKKAGKKLVRIKDALGKVFSTTTKLRPLLSSFKSKVNDFIKKKDPRFVENANNYFQAILLNFRKSKDSLSELHKESKDMFDVVSDGLKSLEKLEESLEKERNFLRKQNRLLRRSLRKGEEIDQVKKQGIIKNISQLNQELQNQADIKKELVNNQRKDIPDMVNKLGEISKDADDLEKSIHFKSWESLAKLLGKMEEFLEGVKNIEVEWGALSNSLTKINEQKEALSKRMNKLLEQKEKDNEMYLSLLEEEQLKEKKLKEVKAAA